MFVEEGMIGLYCSHVMLVWINWRYGPVVYLWVLYSMRRIGFILRRVINTDSRGFIWGFWVLGYCSICSKLECRWTAWGRLESLTWYMDDGMWCIVNGLGGIGRTRLYWIIIGWRWLSEGVCLDSERWPIEQWVDVPGVHLTYVFRCRGLWPLGVENPGHFPGYSDVTVSTDGDIMNSISDKGKRHGIMRTFRQSWIHINDFSLNFYQLIYYFKDKLYLLQLFLMSIEVLVQLDVFSTIDKSFGDDEWIGKCYNCFHKCIQTYRFQSVIWWSQQRLTPVVQYCFDDFGESELGMYLLSETLHHNACNSFLWLEDAPLRLKSIY